MDKTVNIQSKLNVQEKVLTVVSKISGKHGNISLDGNLRNELLLDSIQIVELFAAIEKEFEIELPLQMMTVKTGREFLALLEEQLSQK